MSNNLSENTEIENDLPLAEDITPDDKPDVPEPADSPEPQENIDGQMTDAEKRAYTQGWRPKSEYRGDPEKFTEAGEYLEKAEKYLPIVNKRLDKLTNKMLEVSETTQKMYQVFEDQKKEASKEAYQRGVEEARRKFKKLEDDFADDSEKDLALEELATARAKLINFESEVEAKKGGPNAPPPPPQEVVEFLQDPKNSWYHNDPMMAGEANELYLAAEKANWAPSKCLDYVNRKMAAKHPKLFEPKIPENRPDSGYGGTPASPQSRNSKTWANMTKEAQQTAINFADRSLSSLSKEDKENWAQSLPDKYFKHSKKG